MSIDPITQHIIIEQLINESTFQKGKVEIVKSENKIWWLPFKEEDNYEKTFSDTIYSFSIEDYKRLKKPGNKIPITGYGKWRGVPKLFKNIKQGIVTLVDSGSCMLDVPFQSVVKSRRSTYKDFKGFKSFPSNTVVDFRLTSGSTAKASILFYIGPLLTFKGTGQRIR